MSQTNRYCVGLVSFNVALSFLFVCVLSEKFWILYLCLSEINAFLDGESKSILKIGTPTPNPLMAAGWDGNCKETYITGKIQGQSYNLLILSLLILWLEKLGHQPSHSCHWEDMENSMDPSALSYPGENKLVKYGEKFHQLS